MSNSISINMNQAPFTEVQTKVGINDEGNTQFKVSGFEKEKNESSVEVDISQEGRLKLENSSRNIKKAGVTSQRESWENNTAATRREARSSGGKFDAIESMRIDEPDTYAKWKELAAKADALFPSDDASEEEIAEFVKAVSEEACVMFDWFERRCMATGWFQDPARGQYAALETLEARYSTEGHETSFNFYGTEEAGYRNSLWRFHSKFNVLISANMLKSLDKLKDLYKLSDADKDEVSGLMGKIALSVNKMKEAEKKYEGDLEWLQFGVKLWDNGDVTYHANYKGCENEDGIMANSAEELLEMLMQKNEL